MTRNAPNYPFPSFGSAPVFRGAPRCRIPGQEVLVICSFRHVARYRSSIARRMLWFFIDWLLVCLLACLRACLFRCLIPCRQNQQTRRRRLIPFRWHGGLRPTHVSNNLSGNQFVRHAAAAGMVFRRVAPEQLSQSILHLRRILKKKTEDEKKLDIEAKIAEKQAELAQMKQAAVGRNLIWGY